MSELSAWLRAQLPFERTVLTQAMLEAERRAHAQRWSERELLARLQEQPDELERLRGMVVPPESWLFRHGAAFELAREWLARSNASKVRIASLGCAEGPEAFSLAAVAASVGRTHRSCEIVGVDWSSANLSAATGGRCAPLAQRGVIPEWARAFFEPDGSGSIRLRAEPLSMIQWQHADITRLDGFADCDIVFCRNVAIYLDEPSRRRLADALALTTRADGLLCLGHADPALLWEGAFSPIDRAGAFAFERTSRSAPVAQPVPAFQPAAREPVSARVVSLAPSAPATPTPGRVSLQAAQSLADQGQLTEAAAHTEKLLREEPLLADAWRLLAAIRLAESRNDAAEACLRKVVYLHPDDALALVQLSALVEGRGDSDAADLLRLRAARVVREPRP